MQLTSEEKNILDGRQGQVLQKVMQTLVLYGEALGAECLVDIEGAGHFSIPLALPGIGPRLETLKELVRAGLKTTRPFTLDPRAPMDFEALGATPAQKKRFLEMLQDQTAYEDCMRRLGLQHRDAYTCTPYFPEVGNIPSRDAVLAWSESSCVVYANSVLGARTNRNAAILDLLSNIAGKTPLTGFLTDAGRRADWLIEVRTANPPHPQLLGAAIGMQVLEDVPFITGLDAFLNPDFDPAGIDYLKEMGAACAAIGAVGLYHVENITPEALEHGRRLLKDHYRTYTIDDQLLSDLFLSYPVMWADQNARPQKCMIGCPHLSLRELRWWTDTIGDALQTAGRRQVALPTILFAAPQVIAAFQSDVRRFANLRRMGVRLSDTCPEVYMNNPLCAQEAVVTNSNKFRAFTPARMYLEHDLIQMMVDGALPARSRYEAHIQGKTHSAG